MHEVLLIYRSKYGSAKAYAEMAAERLGGPDVLEAVRARLPKAAQALPLFYGRGAWDPARMTRVDRTLCRMLQRSVAKKPAGTLAPWEQALLEAGQGAANWVEPRYLAPLLSFLQS